MKCDLVTKERVTLHVGNGDNVVGERCERLVEAHMDLPEPVDHSVSLVCVSQQASKSRFITSLRRITLKTNKQDKLN